GSSGSRRRSRTSRSACWVAWRRRTRATSSGAPRMSTSSWVPVSSRGCRSCWRSRGTRVRPVWRSAGRGTTARWKRLRRASRITASFETDEADREPAMRPTPFQAFVRVMMGCDKFCTYCIVPSVRGPEQGRPPASILAEVRLLADQGVKEITLLGQTVNSYRFRQPDGRIWRLSDLLAAIHDIGGIERIKFITNFPNDMTDDLLQAVRDLPRVSRYLHVPARSGCDEVLKRMKRMYTAAAYEEMLARVRETIPGVAVSSDFIVGFCGETEPSFERTVGLVERSRFKNSFIFKYSARAGTKADRLYADDVPEAVKKRRNNE